MKRRSGVASVTSCEEMGQRKPPKPSRPPAADSSDAMSPANFLELFPVSRETQQRIETYLNLLDKWNTAINLVSKTSMRDAWRRHVLDSAQLFRLFPAEEPLTVLDMGSGAGFPGLVLAILGAGEVHLVEADRRKAIFLREVARETGAAVIVHDKRMEDIGPFPVDLVTARALAPLDRLLDLAAPFMERTRRRVVGGVALPVALFLKGSKAEAELTQAGNRWMMEVERFPSLSDPGGTVLRITSPTLRTATRGSK